MTMTMKTILLNIKSVSSYTKVYKLVTILDFMSGDHLLKRRVLFHTQSIHIDKSFINIKIKQYNI